jgi:hypothetical protein
MLFVNSEISVADPEPDLDPFIIKQNYKKNVYSYCFWTSSSLKNYVKVHSKSTYFLLPSYRSMTKIAGSGSISQRHGSADTDPRQNVMDPQYSIGEKKLV